MDVICTLGKLITVDFWTNGSAAEDPSITWLPENETTSSLLLIGSLSDSINSQLRHIEYVNTVLYIVFLE